MKNKVFLVVLEWSNYNSTDIEIKVASTREKAEDIFNEFLQDESVADLLKDCEYKCNYNFSLYAYDINNVVNLYIEEKEVY